MNDPYETICSLGRDIDRLMEDRDEAIKRADAAEDEVARLKARLEVDRRPVWRRTVDATDHPAGDVVKPTEPYTPKVGDVVRGRDYGEVHEAVVIHVGGGYTHVKMTGGTDGATGYHRDGANYYRYLRPATPAERAAAGLPAEAPAATEGALAEAYAQGVVDGQKHQVAIAKSPAAPQVLPEHLAYLEADAAVSVDGASDADWDKRDKSAAELNAAVARRDGGAK